MSKIKTPKKEAVKTPKVLKGVSKKPASFKLITYTMKAVIPVGQYANIQPEITVEAKSIEQAERAVMPHIEALFTKYRDGGVKPIEPVRPVVTQKPVVNPTVPGTVTMPGVGVAPTATALAQAQTTNPMAPMEPVNLMAPAKPTTAPSIPVEATQATVVLTVPFNRAKGAIDSCTSLAALKLVTDQVQKSTKLVDTEKADLIKLSNDKFAQLNANAKPV